MELAVAKRVMVKDMTMLMVKDVLIHMVQIVTTTTNN